MKISLTIISFLLLGNMTAQNLISNGNAEAGDLTGWTSSSSIIEATMQTTQTNGVVTPQEGSYFFTFANEPGETAILTQEGSINNPLERLELSGFFHGEFLSGPGNDDYGEVILSVFDANSNLQNTVSTGELQPDNPESWEEFLLESPLNNDSASWTLELKGTRRIGTFVNVFFDNLVLINSDDLNTLENPLEEIVIYPNPTQDHIHVNLGNTQIQEWSLRDLNGRIIAAKKNITSEASVNMVLNPAGIYLLHLKSELGEVVKRIVKI